MVSIRMGKKILTGSLNAAQKLDRPLMGKFPGSLILLPTAPLTGTHIHPLALSVIPPACFGPLRTPARGILYCAALPAWISKAERREKAAEAAARDSQQQQHRGGNRHRAFCKSYRGNKWGGRSVFYANPIGTIHYLKKCSSVSFM